MKLAITWIFFIAAIFFTGGAYTITLKCVGANIGVEGNPISAFFGFPIYNIVIYMLSFIILIEFRKSNLTWASIALTLLLFSIALADLTHDMGVLIK